eukprot:CAMPEP_0201119354 /NCGR_PEP_ID=MMETSP0850-20130426/3508_1 /ASSEMBLY_ACC=CAM_ASM_000622 /TAXON_ID=183588 /ORGANISM="Pseudo-nitzschia fraudulenta, Strain WWA7" /LENGTH=315 /DNA_ID=CAMNT_0047385031 /DNA_START=49 /DNA_END=996 /DNA_ORIENTATION=-
MDVTFENVACGIVALATLNLCMKAVSHLYKTFLRPSKNFKKYGKWAVVTGATDGIGKAYAFAFAKKGMSILLISRTEAKLQAVKKEIESKNYPGVEVSYLVCDYSKFDKAAQDKVAKVVTELEVGVLVNNVGVSYRYPMFFHELSDGEVQDLMTMNIDSTVWMTRMVLPGMLERKKGAIVNISSASAMYDLPLLAEYSGSKSFVEKFSRAINEEYKSKGINCQAQIPFFVATKLAKQRKSLMVPEPKDFVALAIKWVGYNDAVVSPFFLHAFQGWVMDVLPSSIVASQIMKLHLSIRKRGMKKEAAKAAEASKKD